MRHKADRRRLNRTSEHLQALLGNLVTALIHHEQIQTTVPKAKETRRLAERLITKAKDPSLHTRRRVARTIRDKAALQKLFGTLGPRFQTRPGGYTRIVKIGNRVGDNAPMAILELVERSPKPQPEAETKDQKAGLEKSTKSKPEKALKAEASGATKAKPEAKAKAPKPATKKTSKKKAEE
jgi:large subunit ribosomal protein L17